MRDGIAAVAAWAIDCFSEDVALTALARCAAAEVDAAAVVW
jgi:hypothetical protein